MTADQALGVLEDVASSLLAAAVVVGLVWRLLRPHVETYVRRQTQALAQLQLDDEPDTLAGRARRTADRAEETGRQIENIVGRLDQLEDARLTDRIRLLEVSDDQQNDRLAQLERVLVRELAGQLREERAEARGLHHRTWHEDQTRADRIRDRRRAEADQRDPQTGQDTP